MSMSRVFSAWCDAHLLRLLAIGFVVLLISACGGGSGANSASPGSGAAGNQSSPASNETPSSGTSSSNSGQDSSSGSTNGDASGWRALKPDSDAPSITAAPGTALHHAQQCAQFLGPIPEMSCSDAEIAPITVNGVAVQNEVDTCDRPNALSGACVPGERTSARYQGTYHTPVGLPRPEVTFINFCRAGGMGVIGHNSDTGATCFFSKKEEGGFPNDVAHPGSDDPNSDYDAYWMTAKEVASENCTGCHQADPWLHSPWIDQLLDPNDPSQPLVPVITSKVAPYIVVGDDFSQPYHQGAPDNSCTSCHQPQCDNLFQVKLGELSMPGPFTHNNNFVGVSADLQELRDWCATIPVVGHATTHMGGDSSDGEVDGVCGAFIDCSSSCVSDDFACANACASSHLSGNSLSSSQALFSCLESSGCALDDDSCSDQFCQAEGDSLAEACEL